MELLVCGAGAALAGQLLGHLDLDKKVDSARARENAAHMQVSALREAYLSEQCQNRAFRQTLRNEKVLKWLWAGGLGLAVLLWWKHYDDIELWRAGIITMRCRLCRWLDHWRVLVSNWWQSDHLEIGDILHDGPVGRLGHDFDLCVHDELEEGEIRRVVKIQCTGVIPENVTAELTPNGCIVRITRSSSPGLDPANWAKRIQFPLADYVFEFKEDEMQLDGGILQLVFQACRPRTRVARPQQHAHAGAVLAVQVRHSPGSEATTGSFEHVQMPEGTS
mmetsp:Transcript_46104/g.103672  ORF Transcript_46104/g.103672 Transcript_46104/m.103672 type:complete len:277 (-) Transcript_46104:97-927(-)|eukprot:CAMPEP_0197896554 /NCGR_PEP_ID=MMETSP1439-20131203/40186_1 /TAXON_ID=66791 /ORGANISM="Gonyaulax spinifera, Strain CCMP409" /LENGTH=276 /DNA_ID=CAMNT_0043517097 /DNA_START=95 /DNA_END=925 /DNA_ORIENTATION=+